MENVAACESLGEGVREDEIVVDTRVKVTDYVTYVSDTEHTTILSDFM